MNKFVKYLVVFGFMASSWKASASDQSSLAVQTALNKALTKRVEVLEKSNELLLTRLAQVEQAVRNAQSAANTANTRASSPVTMTGFSAGQSWASCPAGYHWIGGFNTRSMESALAYPDFNQWHSGLAWLCARD